MAGAPHHTVLSKAIGVDVLADFAEMTATEIAGHRRRHHAPQLPARAAVERGVPPAGCGDLTVRGVPSGGVTPRDRRSARCWSRRAPGRSGGPCGVARPRCPDKELERPVLGDLVALHEDADRCADDLPRGDGLGQLVLVAFPAQRDGRVRNEQLGELDRFGGQTWAGRGDSVKSDPNNRGPAPNGAGPRVAGPQRLRIAGRTNLKRRNRATSNRMTSRTNFMDNLLGCPVDAPSTDAHTGGRRSSSG